MITARELRSRFGPTRRVQPRRLSHSIRYDAPGGALVRALCGALVHRDEHAHVREPSCPACQAALAEADALEL